jgi:hypothetical protein
MKLFSVNIWPDDIKTEESEQVQSNNPTINLEEAANI